MRITKNTIKKLILEELDMQPAGDLNTAEELLQKIMAIAEDKWNSPGALGNKAGLGAWKQIMNDINNYFQGK
jgi:hypothetical protein